MAEWKLGDAEKVRDKLTRQQATEISNLYRRVYLSVKKQLESMPKEGTVSQQIQKQRLEKLQNQLDEAYNSMAASLEKQVEKGVKGAAQAVVDSNAAMLKSLGISIEGAYSNVPTDIVETLVSGKLYKGRWSLSSVIWSDVKAHQKDINTIIAEGIAANKSAFDIAKDLETYVDPKAKKPWDWSKVYPGTRKKVDYNAQRLARTMVSHAYQQSLETVSKNNPFITGYKWHSAHSDRVCEICAARNDKIFAKGKLPLDHPNGMCTFTAEMSGSMTDIADELADWAKGKPNKGIDKWMSGMSGDTPVKKEEVIKPTTISQLSKKYGIPVSSRKNMPIDDKYLMDEGFFTEVEEGISWATKNLPGFGVGAERLIKRIEFYPDDYETALAYIQGRDGTLHVNYDRVGVFTSSILAHESVHALIARMTTNDTRDSFVKSLVKQAFEENELKPTKKNMREWVTDYAATDNEECLADAVGRVCINSLFSKSANKVCTSLYQALINRIKEESK